MTQAKRGAILLAVQCALVLTTAGKYLWERHTRPEVWTRVQLYNVQELSYSARNPNDRYMPVQLLADACTLPPRPSEQEFDFNVSMNKSGGFPKYPARKDVVRTAARDGKLIVVEANGIRKSDTQELIWDLRKPCTDARLPDIIKFYVPSNDALPTKLKPGQTVWALVTVPDQGPPRPIELALSDASSFHPLGQK
jgi:hypothetical protein